MFTHNFLDAPKVTVDESSGSRRYTTPNGGSYQSVTKFISEHWDKSFLEKWRKRVGVQHAASESLRATDRGQFMHKMSEYYLRNDLENYRKTINKDPWDKALFLKIKPELNKISNIRLLENSLFSDELKLAGTPDIIGDFNNQFSTIDLKTSTKIKLEEYITTYWLQCSIYSVMVEELFGICPVQSVIIMAVEDSPRPSVFIEPTFIGRQRLDSFIEDPVLFQERLEEDKKARKKMEKRR